MLCCTICDYFRSIMAAIMKSSPIKAGMNCVVYLIFCPHTVFRFILITLIHIHHHMNILKLQLCINIKSKFVLLFFYKIFFYLMYSYTIIDPRTKDLLKIKYFHLIIMCITLLWVKIPKEINFTNKWRQGTTYKRLAMAPFCMKLSQVNRRIMVFRCGRLLKQEIILH